jgi:hypothetical protein
MIKKVIKGLNCYEEEGRVLGDALYFCSFFWIGFVISIRHAKKITS